MRLSLSRRAGAALVPDCPPIPCREQECFRLLRRGQHGRRRPVHRVGRNPGRHYPVGAGASARSRALPGASTAFSERGGPRSTSCRLSAPGSSCAAALEYFDGERSVSCAPHVRRCAAFASLPRCPNPSPPACSWSSSATTRQRAYDELERFGRAHAPVRVEQRKGLLGRPYGRGPRAPALLPPRRAGERQHADRRAQAYRALDYQARFRYVRSGRAAA